MKFTCEINDVWSMINVKPRYVQSLMALIPSFFPSPIFLIYFWIKAPINGHKWNSLTLSCFWFLFVAFVSWRLDVHMHCSLVVYICTCDLSAAYCCTLSSFLHSYIFSVNASWNNINSHCCSDWLLDVLAVSWIRFCCDVPII